MNEIEQHDRNPGPISSLFALVAAFTAGLTGFLVLHFAVYALVFAITGRSADGAGYGLGPLLGLVTVLGAGWLSIKIGKLVFRKLAAGSAD